MKYIGLLVSIALVLFPVTSYAACPDYTCNLGPGPSGSCPNCFYSFDTSCATTSNVSDTTLSFCNWPGHQFLSGSGSVDYSMTVPSGHGSSCKSVVVYVDFSDSTSSSQDAISVTVIVRHNGSVTYADAYYFHDGTQGLLTCSLAGSSTFSAAAGDTIEVSVTATNTYGATIKVTPPLIWD